MGRARHDRCSAVASHPVCFHDHVSLSVPAVDDGAGPAHRGVQVARPVAPRRVVQRSRPLLGADLRPQLRHGRGDRHPDGVPVRHQLVDVLPLLGRGRRPGPGDGGSFSRSSSSRRSWGCSSSARSGSARGGTSRRPSPWPWARGCRATSSSSPTPSCSTRSATGWARTGCYISRVSGRTSSTPGRSGNTPTTCWPRSSRRRSSWPPWGPTGRSWASTPGTPGSACAWG